MTAKKAKEEKKTFAQEVADVLKRLPVSRDEKGNLVDRIEKIAEKHFE